MEVIIKNRSSWKHCIAPTHKDLLLVENLKIRKVSKKDVVNIKNNIVAKPWGFEYLCGKNKYFEVWELYINPLSATSLHCHPEKDTLNIVVAGKASLETINKTEKLISGSAKLLKASTIHKTINKSKKNILRIIEIESPPNKNNLIRINDDYGRESLGYVKFNTKKNLRTIKRCFCADNKVPNSNHKFEIKKFIENDKKIKDSLAINELRIHNLSFSDYRSELKKELKKIGIKNLVLLSGSLSLQNKKRAYKLLPGACIFDTPIDQFIWSSKQTNLLIW